MMAKLDEPTPIGCFKDEESSLAAIMDGRGRDLATMLGHDLNPEECIKRG